MGWGGQTGAAKRDGGHSHLLASQDLLSQTTQQTWAKRSVPSTLAELPTGILSGQKEPRKEIGSCGRQVLTCNLLLATYLLIFKDRV